ncbi:PaaI family thioesterase [Paraburkholderia sp. EG287A]|uniref:PaaI family thioesterase n=1 Tax=unclassified Paraburkholderia TaxID=2615204 RepID=UPI0034D2567A
MDAHLKRDADTAFDVTKLKHYNDFSDFPKSISLSASTLCAHLEDGMALEMFTRQSNEGTVEWLQRVQAGRGWVSPIYETLKISVVQACSGFVQLSMTASSFAGNPTGKLHGGALATILDCAMALAVDSALGATQVSATAEMSVRFMGAQEANGSTVLASGSVTQLGRRLAFATAEVVDESGRLLANAAGTFVVNEARLKPTAN